MEWPGCATAAILHKRSLRRLFLTELLIPCQPLTGEKTAPRFLCSLATRFATPILEDALHVLHASLCNLVNNRADHEVRHPPTQLEFAIHRPAPGLESI